MTANACIFWSNIVSANSPSITPPNAIRIGGVNESIKVKWPKWPNSENAYIFNEADSINGINVVQANGNVEPPTVFPHLKLKVALLS